MPTVLTNGKLPPNEVALLPKEDESTQCASQPESRGLAIRINLSSTSRLIKATNRSKNIHHETKQNPKNTSQNHSLEKLHIIKLSNPRLLNLRLLAKDLAN